MDFLLFLINTLLLPHRQTSQCGGAEQNAVTGRIKWHHFTYTSSILKAHRTCLPATALLCCNVFTLWVCLCVCVIMAKWGPGDTFCHRNYYSRSGVLCQVFICLSVETHFCQCDSVMRWSPQRVDVWVGCSTLYPPGHLFWCSHENF